MIPRRFTGIAARQIAATHIKAVAFAMFVLWTVAIAIDLGKYLDELRATAAQGQIALLPLMGEYLLYRTSDIVSRLLPMAGLVGGFIAELLRHQRMEPVILSAAGARPSMFFAALLGAGLIVGSVQLALEAWLRPAAVLTQIDLGVGAYAARFHHGDHGRRWFVDGDRAIEARVFRGHSPDLRDLRVFEGVGTSNLRRILSADRAVPTADPLIWELQNAVTWEASSGQVMHPKTHERLLVPLPLSPTHVKFHGIYGYYLSNNDLLELVKVAGSDRWPEAQTSLMRRVTALFLPGLFMFLGASLSQAGRNGRLFAWWRLLALGTVGYISVVSVKSFWTLGDYGAVSPLAATTWPLLFALCLGVALQLHMNGFPELRGRRG